MTELIVPQDPGKSETHCGGMDCSAFPGNPSDNEVRCHICVISRWSPDGHKGILKILKLIEPVITDSE